MSDTNTLNTSPENRVSRVPERGFYDKQTIYAILDSTFICNIGFICNDKPIVIPMTCWREGEYIYFHSGAKGRFALACASSDICLTVTIFDGLVLGHSAFNHSFNYRSVVVHGRAEAIDDPSIKSELMKSFVEHVMPGRYKEIRPVKENEIRALTIMRLNINEASAKIRDEFPDEETVSPDWPVWVGVIPAKIVYAPPVQDPERNKINPVPGYIANYRGADRHKPNYHSSAFDSIAVND